MICNNPARSLQKSNCTGLGWGYKMGLLKQNIGSRKMSESFISWSYDEQEQAYIIAHLWVPVEERGKGVARKMLQEAIEEMRAEGKADQIKLSADSESEDPENPIELADLVEFYESVGFDIEYAGEVVIMAMDI